MQRRTGDSDWFRRHHQNHCRPFCRVFNSCKNDARCRKLIRTYLTVPVTTATAERTFSVLRRLKKRATMFQEWLNNLLLLHIHKDRTVLDMYKIAEEFAGANNRRRKSLFISHNWCLIDQRTETHEHTKNCQDLIFALVMHCVLSSTSCQLLSCIALVYSLLILLQKGEKYLLKSHFKRPVKCLDCRKCNLFFPKFSGGHAPRPP